ncbi:MAG: PilZ domain-containing protein [Desulfobacterales bacterium]|nr:PilZ domain-containing protein [Desulfobacterales bacterium]
MFSTLHQFLNHKLDADLSPSSRESKKHEIIARLYQLLQKLSDEQKLSLLKLLIRDRLVDFLFKQVIDLSENQRLVLMKHLEQITSKADTYDRRDCPRKDCLINAKISVSDRILNCFILDISPFGAFIDTDDGIVVGQPAKVMFSAPNTRERLIISGKVVWTKDQGAGIQFNRKNQKHLQILRSFTEKEEKVYEITSC